jgi:very-short-patch-repair endonuclease
MGRWLRALREETEGATRWRTGSAYQRARAFRRNLTPPEARLWIRLKGDRLGGLGFRKQHPIGPYILDFYCAAAKLAVEVDGASHNTVERSAHDARRTVWLAGKGIRVIRIAALAVRDEINAGFSNSFSGKRMPDFRNV